MLAFTLVCSPVVPQAASKARSGSFLYVYGIPQPDIDHVHQPLSFVFRPDGTPVHIHRLPQPCLFIVMYIFIVIDSHFGLVGIRPRAILLQRNRKWYKFRVFASSLNDDKNEVNFPKDICGTTSRCLPGPLSRIRRI